MGHGRTKRWDSHVRTKRGETDTEGQNEGRIEGQSNGRQKAKTIVTQNYRRAGKDKVIGVTDKSVGRQSRSDGSREMPSGGTSRARAERENRKLVSN